MKDKKPKRTSLIKRMFHWHASTRTSAHAKSLIRTIKSAKRIPHDSSRMIEGVLKISDMQARDIMTPRPKMVMIDHRLPLEEIQAIVVDSGHSRFPVVGDNRDEIKGVLLAKDLLRYFSRASTKGFDINAVLRQAFFVPESKKLNILLKEFRHHHNHLVVVVDEYGGVAGLVTIEDVLEQIVGEIEDEFDDEQGICIEKLSRHKYIVKSLTSVDEFNEYFGCKMDHESFDTIGGLVTHALGHVAKRGEKIVIDQFHFKVLRTSQKHIQLLRLKLIGDQ